MATIDQLQIQIETNAEGAIQGLSQVRTVLETLDKVSKSTGLDVVYRKLQKISQLNFSNLQQLNTLNGATSQVGDLSNNVNDLSSSIAEVPDTIGVTADTGGVTDVVTDVEQVSDAVNSIPRQTEVNVNTPGMDTAQKKTVTLRSALDRLRAVSTKVSTAFKSVSSRLRNASSVFDTTAKKTNSLFKMMGRVMLYAGAYRIFYTLISSISEGLQNMAKFSDETATAMSRLSTMGLYLKNAIGAALYPLIVAMTPALQSMTNALVRAFETFSQLVSLLSGKSTYLKAKEYLKEYGDKAKKTAKDIKKSFAGMDEITVIGKKDSGSSGDEENYSQMFEETPINNPKLQALLPFFKGLGEVLSNCFKTIKELANDYLYPWLVKIGNWCKENPDKLEAIGEGLAYVVVALIAIKGVGGVLKFILSPLIKLFSLLSNLGVFKAIGSIFKAIGKAFLFVVGFCKDLVFAFQWVASGAGTVSEALEFAFGGASGIIGGVILAIAGLIRYISNLVDMFKNGESWSNVLGAALGGLGAAAGAFLIALGVGATVATGGIAALVVGIVALAGILTAFIVNHWEEISGFFARVWEAIVSFFSSLFEVIAPFIQLAVTIWTVLVGIFTAITSVISFVTTLPAVMAILAIIVGLFTKIGVAIMAIYTVAQIVWHYISTKFLAVYEVVVHIIGEIISIIWGVFKAVWAVVSKIAEIVSTIVQIIWAVVSWLFGLIWDFISGIASWVWDKALKPIVDKITSIVNIIKTKVIDPIVNFFKGMIDIVVGFFKNIAIIVVDAISGTFKSVLNGVFSLVEKVVNFFIKGINGAVGIINKIPGVDIKKIELLSIPRFATGGFPEDGLFMANHGELVGKFSNGKTAVANNEQIVEGITGGVYAANQEQNGLLREQNKLLRQLVENKSNGQIDVTTITSAMQRKNRRDGRTIVPVGI